MTPEVFFDQLENHLSKELPLVVYRKPMKSGLRALLQNTDTLYEVKNFKESGFVFAPFDSQSRKVLIQSSEMLELASYSPKKFEPEEYLDIDLKNVGNKDHHLRLVQNAVSSIKQGHLKKVVLSRILKGQATMKPLSLFQRLLALYSNAFCYLFYHPKVGLWLGATPEILLQVKNNRLTTMSLAGTKPYVNGQEPEWGEKEILEQKYVTEYIEEALKNEISELNSGSLESARSGKLWHLRTKISGNIENQNLEGVLEKLHPTPAVCGLPKLESKAFILENEGYDRQFYTGYLGELNMKQEKMRSSRRANQENQVYRSINRFTELFVNLRCMQLVKDQALIYVGGGITAGSDPENEWDETVLKSKTMSSIL
ncbi:isochorismate synthase [Euzebyella marina]|uniref:Isochorismate synthase n=1 Tax=Euzebyella marina TaxID=1761453 RepID=A0A3G2L7Q8_9FLAO|nr:chorismate-binding protein [Euzebyella marina]AYN68304.1 isochorismate synthase [Euzebyella marina]